MEEQLTSSETVLREYISKHLSEFDHETNDKFKGDETNDKIKGDEANDKIKEDKDIGKVHSLAKQNPKRYSNESITFKFSIETIVQITLILTLIANVYISICLNNIDASLKNFRNKEDGWRM